jgi:hypothetical protein
MPTEAMKIARVDRNQPDLRIGNPLPQPLGRPHFIPVQLVFARLDVDDDELVLVCRRQIGPDPALDQRVPTAGELLAAIATNGRRRGVPGNRSCSA